MPGMKLDFLKNPHQRIATGKSLPLRQVEAIVLYGRPEQRAKVVEKLLPSTYGLSLNKTTHHILITLLEHTDNLSRVNMLYNVRRKILDLCTSPVGNVVLQKMIEKVPARQRREIAQAFVLNVEEDEFRRLCEHPFGNHVAQKLLEFPECAEVLEQEGLLPYLGDLGVHPYGMRVVAKYIEGVNGGWKRALHALIPGTPIDDLNMENGATDDMPDDDAFLAEDVSEAIDAGVARLFAAQNESMVIAAFLKSSLVPAPFKDAIVAHLCEYASEYLDPKPKDAPAKDKSADDEEYAMPDFGTAGSPKKTGDAAGDALKPRHIHAYCAALEHCDQAQRTELWKTLSADESGLLGKMVSTLATSPVAVAATRFFDDSRPALYTALIEAAEGGKSSKKALDIATVAEDSVRTLLLRTFLDVEPERVTKAQRAELVKHAVRLSQSPTASPVLQKLLESDPTHDIAGALYKSVKKSLPELVSHKCASFFVQALLEHADEDVRKGLGSDLWEILGQDLRETLSYSQGSHVMQKLLAYAPDDVITDIVNQMTQDAEDEAAEAEATGSDDEADDEEDDDEEAEDGPSDSDSANDAAEGDDDEEEEEQPKKPLSRLQQVALNRAKHYGVRSHAVVDYALHNHASFVIRALLRETRSRQLDKHRKALMDELKPHVFDLAVSPWAGRLVLEAMMAAGSAQLAEAMKNVVFLKAEEWLSDVSDAKKRRGAGIDATTKDMLKRQREMNASEGGNNNGKAAGKENGNHSAKKARA